jgi:hypothetical protein
MGPFRNPTSRELTRMQILTHISDAPWREHLKLMEWKSKQPYIQLPVNVFEALYGPR